MTTKNLHQSVLFKATPKKIYEALMDSKQHSKITGSEAVIGTEIGSPFSVWGGGINGITVALDPGKKIVQAWRNEEWEKYHYSIAVFDIQKSDGGAKLEFYQYGIPENDYKSISDGWKDYYWEPLKEMFSSV